MTLERRALGRGEAVRIVRDWRHVPYDREPAVKAGEAGVVVQAERPDAFVPGWPTVRFESGVVLHVPPEHLRRGHWRREWVDDESAQEGGR